MRITDQYTQSTLVQSVGSAMKKLLEAEQQIMSGKRIGTVSQDPMAASQVLNINVQLSKIEDWKNNAAKAQEDVKAGYDALTLFQNQLMKIDELAIQAANGGNSTEMTNALKIEIEARTKALVKIANTQYGDTYIFAGTNTQTPPYLIDNDLSVTYQGTPSDGAWQRKSEVFDGDIVTTNVLGANVFGDETSGVFATLKTLNDALAFDPPDLDTVRDQLDKIKNGISSISNGLSGVSNTAQHLNAVSELSGTVYENLIESRSALQDADIITASTELAKAQSALEASLKISSVMLSRPSLLNYL